MVNMPYHGFDLSHGSPSTTHYRMLCCICQKGMLLLCTCLGRGPKQGGSATSGDSPVRTWVENPIKLLWSSHIVLALHAGRWHKS